MSKTKSINNKFLESTTHRGIRYTLYKGVYEWGACAITAMLIGCREYGSHNVYASSVDQALKTMNQHIDSLIDAGLIFDKRRKEDAKLAAMTSAAALYNLLETFETEVGVHVPMTVIDMMAKKNGEYLRSVYGNELMEQVKEELQQEKNEALEKANPT